MRAGSSVRPVLGALVVGGGFALAWAIWDATRAEAGLVDPPAVAAAPGALDPVDPVLDAAGDELDGTLPALSPGGLVSSVIEPLPAIVLPLPLLSAAELPVVASVEPPGKSGHPPVANPVGAAAADAIRDAAVPGVPGSAAPRPARGSEPDVPGPKRPDPRPADERPPVAPNPQPALAAVPSSSSAATGSGPFAVLMGAPVIPAAARWRRTVQERAPPRRVWAFSIDNYG